MGSYKKLVSIFLLLTTPILYVGFLPAAETAGSSSSLKSEAETLLSSIKEKEVEDQLIQSNQFGECSKQAEGQTAEERKDTIRKCFQDQLDSKSDEEISKFATEVDLSSFDKKAASSSSSIREYLSKRMQKAIHGKDYDPTKIGTKHKKFVGQDKYFDLYESQLNKNILLDISRYCLENLRYKKKPIRAFCANNKSFPYSSCLFAKQDTDPSSKSDPSATNDKSPMPADENGNAKSSIVTFFGQEVEEVEYNSADNKATDIQKFSEEEFQFGAEYLGAKYQLCATGVSLLCKRYECNNTISDPENKECKKLIGSAWVPKTAPTSDKVELDKDSTTSTGRQACGLVSRLKEYRKTLIAVAETKKKLLSSPKSQSGYQLNVAYGKGIYQGGKGSGEKSINEITTISSREITENKEIKVMQDLDKKAEQLVEDCKGQSIDQLDEKCRGYVEKEETFDNVEVEFEAVTALELKRIQALQQDEKALQKYLTENGLSSYKDLTPDQLTKLIADKYKAERMALINKMRDEFNNKKIQTQDSQGKPVDDKQQIEAQISKAAEEIKDQKDRIGNLIHYNNIITSFLETKVVDSDGKAVDAQSGKNSTSFIVEQEGFDKFKPENDDTNAQGYLKDLSENVEESDDDYQTGGGVDIIESIISLEL